ncbi:MAG: MoaD/ThiS family protein [Acidobacteriota bacterium]|nr:MoaD/ThiS family protein [Acidobacteriota bacterium]
MIKVNVLFFGATAEAVGVREIAMDFAAETRSNEVFAAIKNKYPRLNEHKLLFSINQAYADGDEPIQNGDELAVFTPVSGG